MPIQRMHETEPVPVRREIVVERAEEAAQTRATSDTLLSPGLDRVTGFLLGALPFALYLSGALVPALSRVGAYIGALVLFAIGFAYFVPLRPYARLRKTMATTMAVYLVPMALASLAFTGLMAVDILRRQDPTHPHYSLTRLMDLLPVAAVAVTTTILSIAVLRAAFRRGEP